MRAAARLKRYYIPLSHFHLGLLGFLFAYFLLVLLVCDEQTCLVFMLQKTTFGKSHTTTATTKADGETTG